jgi:hypothetical protein
MFSRILNKWRKNGKSQCFNSISFDGKTRSKMQVVADNKKITIEGEATPTPNPKFYADTKSMINWDPPYEAIKITEEEKKEIIDYVERESKKLYVQVIFD